MTFPFNIVTRAEWDARQPRNTKAQSEPHEAFIHHTESGDAAKVETRRQMTAAVQSIQNYHMDEKGWWDIGYHFLIFQPNARHEHATIFQGRYVLHIPAAQLEHNTGTLACAVYGDGRREEMHRNTRFAIESLIASYGKKVKKVGGHRDVVSTECPGDRFYAAIPRICRAIDREKY